MTRPRSHRGLLVRLVVALAALALLAAACSDDSSDGGAAADGTSSTTAAAEATTTQPATTAPIPETGEALESLQLNVVEFGPDGYVEIINTGADSVNLAGVFICEFPDYQNLVEVVDVEALGAGETVQVAAEHLGGISADSGEAALYNGNDFGSSDAILSYVQWGEGDHRRSSVAAEAGIWPSSADFVTPDPAFNSIESGGFAADPEGWS